MPFISAPPREREGLLLVFERTDALDEDLLE
jgi:hypothetical protein